MFAAHATKSKDRSSVWFHFLTNTKDESAKCIKCGSIIKAKGGSTSGMRTHLKKHDIKLIHEDVTEELSVVPAKKTLLSTYFPAQREDLNAVLARLSAMDGIPFNVLHKSIEIRKSLLARKLKVPESATTIRKCVITFFEEKKLQMKNELMECKKLNKFSLSFDEWTSIANKRFMNIILHGNNSHWNLGLVGIKAAATAEYCVSLLKDRLSNYELDLSKDIVSLTTDGASTMVKVGKLIDPNHQLCYAHGIQLGITDVLYKKNYFHAHGYVAEVVEYDGVCSDEDVDAEEVDDEDDEQDDFEEQENLEIVESFNLHQIIEKVRKIVRSYRKSPTKDQVLQNYVQMENKKPLKLIIDCKTRWNSLIQMLERFIKLESSLKKAAVDLKSEILEDFEFHLIKKVVEILKPAELAIEALCRQDVNLASADVIIKFMLAEIKKVDSPLACEIFNSIEQRMKERTTSYTAVLKVLTTGCLENYNKNVIIRDIVNLIKRLNEVDDTESNSDDPEIIYEIDENETLQQKLDKLLKSSQKPKPKNTNYTLKETVKSELNLFLDGGRLGDHTEKAFKYLKTIPPTSVECERCFSTSGRICNKLRSRLNDRTLDALVFLKAYFLKKEK